MRQLIDRQTKIEPPGDPSGPPGGAYAWLKLLIGVGVVVLFMFVIAPLGDRLPGFGSAFKFIEDRNLKATALYYTDIDEFGEAAVTLRNNREYTPKGP